MFSGLLRPFANDLLAGVGDGDGHAVIAIQAMSGTADSWVVGAHRHFDAV
jgi:hypothetical protein